MLRLVASFCAPLPSVSENDRNSARIAITSAMRLLKNSACSPSSAFSIASLTSDMMAPGSLSEAPFCQSVRGAQVGLSPRVCSAVGADQAFGVDFCVHLRCRQITVAEKFLESTDVTAAGQQMGVEEMAQRV